MNKSEDNVFSLCFLNEYIYYLPILSKIIDKEEAFNEEILNYVR